MSDPAKASRGLYAIDLLRFAAAFMVMAYHYLCSFALDHDPDLGTILPRTLPTSAASWALDGWVGVEIFFVISGYVIAMSAQGAGVGDFVQRRVERLVPAAWVCGTITALALLLMAVNPTFIAPRWINSMLFIPKEAQIDGSYWTLGIETSFYALTALIIMTARGRERLGQLAIGLGLYCALFWLVLQPLSGLGGGQFLERKYQLMLVTQGAFFALGMVLQRCAARGWTWRWQVYGALLLYLCALSLDAHCQERALRLARAVPLDAPLLMFLLGVLIMGAAHRLQPLLARHMNGRAVQTLGLMTYPLYLLHHTLGAVLIAALMHAGSGYYPAVLMIMTLMIAAAWAIVRYAEPLVKAQIRRAIQALRLALTHARPVLAQ